MSVDEMRAQLEQLPLLRDCPPELSQSIAEKIHRPLTRKYQEVARSVFLASSSASGAARRKTHAELQEKLATLLLSIQQFDRGVKALPADDLQSQLSRHLLRTLCSDLTNLVVGYLASEHVPDAEAPPNMAPEVRQKLIQKLPADIRGPVLKLHQSLSAKAVEDFLANVDVVLGPGICDMIIRSDKKKERQWLQSHRQALLQQLCEAGGEASLCLHLCVLLVAQAQSQRALHASGRFVPQLLAALRAQLPADVFADLHRGQELVMKQLTLDEASEEKAGVAAALEELVPRLKEIGATYKKQGAPAAEE